MRGGRFLRRGMSPLIATVLLMAFAVALGGMIMNWSMDANTHNDCDKIDVAVQQFCSTDKGVLLSLRNGRDSVPLRGVKVNLIEAGFESTFSIRDSALQPGQPLENIQVPAGVTEFTKASIVAAVGPETNPITCTEPLAKADPLQPC